MDDETRAFMSDAAWITEGAKSPLAGRAVEAASRLMNGDPIGDTYSPWEEHLAQQAAVVLVVFGRDARAGLVTALAIEGAFERAVSAVRSHRSKAQKQGARYVRRGEG